MAISREQLIRQAEAMDALGVPADEIQEYVNTVASASITPPKNEKEKQGVLEKFSRFSEATFGRLADTMFGTTGKTVGKLGLTLGEGIAEAATGKTIEEMGRKRVGYDVLQRGKEPAPSATDVAFTALELTPAVGPLAKMAAAPLAKIPGVRQAAAAVAKPLKGIPGALRRKAAEQYSRVINPTTKRAKEITEKVVPELIERGVTAGSRTGLEQRVAAEARVAGERVGEVAEAVSDTIRIKTQPILDALERTKQAVTITENGKSIVAEPSVVKAADDLMDVVGEFGKDVSVGSIRKLRQIWDKTIAKSKKGFAPLDETTTVDLKRTATKAIREELAQKVPDLAKVNAEFSFWSNVQEVLEQTAARRVGQAKPIGQRIAKGAGFVGGAASGGLGSGFLMAEVLGTLSKVVNSTAWATFSAVQKNKLADAIANGQVGTAFTILSKVIAATKNTLTEE